MMTGHIGDSGANQVFPIKKNSTKMKKSQEGRSIRGCKGSRLGLPVSLYWFPGNIPAFIYCLEQKLLINILLFYNMQDIA